MILAPGATGPVGAELVRTLAAAGEPVRALVRDASRAAALPDGVEAVAGDLNRPETLEPAIEGVRGVHLLAGDAGLPDALDRMRRAGVERVTLQSSSAVPVALTTGGLDGRSLRLSGPEALLAADRVAILASVLGRDLRLEPQSDDDTRVAMGATMPAEYVDAFFSFFVDGTL